MTSRTKYPEIFDGLARPFESDEVKVRNIQNRREHYVTARTVMNRLDEVLGPENWADDYIPGDNSVMCKLSIRLPDESCQGGWLTLTKCDAGGYAGMPDQGDDDKSGFSDALKRAAVKFGVGRYLYKDGVPSHGSDPEPSSQSQQRQSTPESNRPPEPQRQSSGTGSNSVPRSGRALFAWTKEQSQRHEVGLLKYLNGWAKLQDFPGRMIDWEPDQVALAYAEAVRKLQSISGGQSEAYEESMTNGAGGVAEPPASTHQAGDLGEPDGTIPRPTVGKELYLVAKDWEKTLSTTLVAPCRDWMKARGIAGQIVDWSGANLDLAWRYISAKVAEASGKPGTLPARVPTANLEVVAKAAKLLKMVFRVDTRPAPEAIFAEINRVYGSLYPGETIGEFKSFADTGRLKALSECFDELIQEQANEPAF